MTGSASVSSPPTEGQSQSVNALILFQSSDHFQAEVRAQDIFNALLDLCKDYLWERDSPIFELFQTHSGRGISSFTVSLNFGEGYLDEWYLVEQLFRLSEILPVCIAFPDPEEDPLLLEAAEMLPSWINGSEDAKNRVFIWKGSVCVIIPSEMKVVSEVVEGVKYLFDNSDNPYLRNKQINAVILKRRALREWEQFPVHFGTVAIPVEFALLLQAYPQLVSVIVDHLPVDPDVNRAVLRHEFSKIDFLCHSRQTEVAEVALKFTRLQWAKLRSFDESEVLSTFRKISAVSLIGKLLMSGLCCSLKRNPCKVFGAAARVKAYGSSIDLIQKLLLAVNSNMLDQTVGGSDEAWLHEEPTWNEEDAAHKIETNPKDFQRILDQFLKEEDSSSSVSEEGSLSSWEEDQEARHEFDQLEEEIKNLRLGENIDPLDAFLESMNAEGTEHVGPASVLFAQLAQEFGK